MRSLGTALARGQVYAASIPERKLKKYLPQVLVEKALQTAGLEDERKRRLPVHRVLWMMILAGLYRDLSLEAVVDRFKLALPGKWPTVASSAVPQRRAFLGDLGPHRVFEAQVEQIALPKAREPEREWRGLSLFAADATTLSTPDTQENREAFGKPRNGKGETSQPLVRLVCVVSLFTRLVIQASFDGWLVSELGQAAKLFALLPERSMVILDRLYHSAFLLWQFTGLEGSRHFLVRAKDLFHHEIVEWLPDGSALARVIVPDSARLDHPEMPSCFTLRIVWHKLLDGSLSLLLTSLLDHEAYPGPELAAQYHGRWEIETAWREVKSSVESTVRTLRSKLAFGVRQEIWSLLIAYNIARLEILDVAIKADVPPTEISYKGTLEQVEAALIAPRAPMPSQMPSVKHLILRRSPRPRPSCPREKKYQVSRYPKKKARKQARVVEKAAA